MIKFSLLFPDVLFTLWGNGEENEDMWVAYFKNGKSQVRKATISFVAFSEKDLE